MSYNGSTAFSVNKIIGAGDRFLVKLVSDA